MKNLLLLILLMTLISSCRSTKTIPKTQTTERTVKDSTSRELVVKDTIIVIQKADTVRIFKPIKELTEKPITIKSRQATITLRKVNDSIEATCECEELKKAVEIYKETIFRLKEINAQQSETIVELKTQMPGWAKPFLWLGIIFTVILFGLAAISIIKKKPF